MEILTQFFSEWDGPSVSAFVLGVIILGYQLRAKEALDHIEQDAAGKRGGGPGDGLPAEAKDAPEQPRP